MTDASGRQPGRHPLAVTYPSSASTRNGRRSATTNRIISMEAAAERAKRGDTFQKESLENDRRAGCRVN